jgi:peptidoglycan/xylan/chitin deacetylase (PgdA/CDA1 family)
MASKKGVGRSRVPLEHMSPEEVGDWILTTREALQKKMQRERAYLGRRAARGFRTPTDEAYEADLVLEADVLAMLDEMEQVVKRTF